MTGHDDVIACQQPSCTGSVGADGYCDVCGHTQADLVCRPDASPAPGSPEFTTGTALTGPRGSLATGSIHSGGKPRKIKSHGASTRRTAIGAGITNVPSAPEVDPATAVMADPVVAEAHRYCSNSECDNRPVGRSRGHQVGLLCGFCSACGRRFDFRPKLAPGEVVGGQYKILGCLAHGGLGWIYLAYDEAVEQWVVLKGLLNATDQAAMNVALAEKRFLAAIKDDNIVDIYNFVSHGDAGYIVMEYVSGRSLKQILTARREDNGGRPDPLPVNQAIALVLAVLPAFTYLHTQGLVYCDFKPDNVIHTGDRVKLIDLGAVHRLDDRSGDIFGTVGFQAPEVADRGVSVSSDLYTVGRALAVLTLDFRGYQRKFKHFLPDPSDHPALARFDSFHRFLLKATAPHPDDRFQSASEMGEQLLGVLQEVVALTTGRPQPAPSAAFAPPSDDEALPPLAIDGADDAATFLANLSGNDPAAVLAEIEAAVVSGQVEDSLEVRLRRARAYVESGDHTAAMALLGQAIADDPWEWRAVWLQGIIALDSGTVEAATAAFDRCWSEVPGELAPKLAAALAGEARGDLGAAAALYGLVVTVDPSYIAAARGLARCRLAVGDTAGAMAAYDRIAESHRAFAAAQLEAIGALIAAGELAEAANRLDRLELDDRRRAQLDIDLLEAALQARMAGTLVQSPAARIAGRPLDERSLRFGLEDARRRLARLTADPTERRLLVEEANRVRPRTLL